MNDRVKSEPVMALSFVMACVALGTAFGLELSAEQVAAIQAAVACFLGLLVRRVVTPTKDIPAKGDGE